MKTRESMNAWTAWSRPLWLFWLSALVLGAGSAILAGHPVIVLAFTACVGFVLFALKSLREPIVFVTVFLLTIILLPPFYWDRIGETPIYASTLLVPLGVAVLLLRFPDFKVRLDLPAWAVIVFLLGTGLSLPFGWWLSGTQVGNQSLLRWLMLAQTALIYFLVRGGALRQETRLERVLIPVLLIAATLSAAYGVLDFVWPIPIPHPAADQYIWLRTSIMRRAQGVFYEAGNFANLCALLLVIAVSALLSKRERDLSIPMPWLVVCVATLGLGVFVSFTRSTWASVLVAILAFAIMSNEVSGKRLGLCLALLGVPVVALRLYSFGLWDYLLSSRLGNLSQLLVDPNLASSGRMDTWNRVLTIIAAHPQYLFFGVGYKTLPVTWLFHQPTITDNGFLNLLLESGIVGLGGFIFFSALILKTCAQMTKGARNGPAFWGAVLFSFWCGECVQMLAVDAYTYWRTMTVFVALMAYAMNLLERDSTRFAMSHPDPPRD